jgi:protocatechuate 3,4-dioxygenase beta subunit
MGKLSRVVRLASILVVASTASSFPQDTKKEPTGSITGRVTVAGRPAARVSVTLRPSDQSQMQQYMTKAVTDEEGRFTLKSIPAGNYTILPNTPALVASSDTSFGQPGKSITLADGEEVDGIDFTLVKGSVITGRVTDADGRPLIEQRINLIRVDERGQRVATPFFNPYMFTTDDRGVFRIYGLMAGRYKVSAGESSDSGAIRVGFEGGSYARTFHPDVADESRAPAVEISAGGEAAGIDIRLGRVSKTYVATGRIIDADTGKPLANLNYGHGPVHREGTNFGSYGWTSNRTNTNGEFRIEGLTPGRYAAFAAAMEQVGFYSEPAVFEISDSDVGGIEIKTRAGSSISGVVTIEGTDDPDVLARLPKLELRSSVLTTELAAPMIAPVRINPDGSFLISGLRPGKARILFNGFGSEAARGFLLMRIEREGVSLRDSIEIAPGENLSGVRVILGYGTCVVRGQVKVQGGELAPNIRMIVTIRRIDNELIRRSAALDARNRFSLEGLVEGEYEITVISINASPSQYPPGVPPPPTVVRSSGPLAKQNFTATQGAVTDITLVVDLAAKDKENEK